MFRVVNIFKKYIHWMGRFNSQRAVKKKKELSKFIEGYNQKCGVGKGQK